MKSHREDPDRNAGRDDDPLLREWFASVDPEGRDPRYWDRFHDRVMAAARAELARRRRAAPATISEMVSSWSGAVVPAALAAAAVAAFLLLRPTLPGPVAHVGVEELLAEGVESEPVPMQPFEGGTGTEAVAVFAGEIF
jgi:hypothetical protein